MKFSFYLGNFFSKSIQSESSRNQINFFLFIKIFWLFTFDLNRKFFITANLCNLGSIEINSCLKTYYVCTPVGKYYYFLSKQYWDQGHRMKNGLIGYKSRRQLLVHTLLIQSGILGREKLHVRPTCMKIEEIQRIQKKQLSLINISSVW